MGRLTAWRVKILGVKCNVQAVLVWTFLWTLRYIMGGVLRWGDRDMLQPSDSTREKKKRKIF